MKILIRYSESSHQDTSDGIFGFPLSLGFIFSIFGPQTMGYSLMFFLKNATFLTI